jgi:RNA polymerase sigma-70 factor, ECF subfamily
VYVFPPLIMSRETITPDFAGNKGCCLQRYWSFYEGKVYSLEGKCSIYAQKENPNDPPAPEPTGVELVMTAPTPPQETELMRRIVAREQNALAELYDLVAPMVYGMAMRVVNNSVLAEEVTQDTFMKVWRQAERWDSERGKLITWILTIARYTAIDRLQREQRQVPSHLLNLEDMLSLVGRPAVVDQNYWFDKQLLQSLIVQLPREQIECIELSFYKGMSHQEISDHLDQPLGTVKSRIRQGLLTLRRLWQHAES